MSNSLKIKPAPIDPIASINSGAIITIGDSCIDLISISSVLIATYSSDSYNTNGFAAIVSFAIPKESFVATK